MLFSTNIPSFSSFWKKSQMLDLTKSIPDTSEVSSNIGGNVVSKALTIAQEVVDFTSIKYIGVTGDSSVLGVASTEYNENLLQNLLSSITNMEQNPENISQQDQQKVQEIKVKTELLRGQHALVSFQVNPSAIVNEVEQYMTGIKQELQNNEQTFEDLQLNESQVKNDLLTVRLASVFAHEAKHALGGSEMQGESGAVASEKATLSKTIIDESQHQEYNYLKQFQIIQNNIGKA